jgi:putative PEP-CTERM system TPR-repeat lipoprotein
VTPENSESDFDIAKRYLAAKEFDKALDIAEKMIRAKPTDPLGHDVQGAAYQGKKDLERARKSFDEALRVAPGDVVATMTLAEIDLQQKRTASARSRYTQLLDKDPKLVPALISMANVEVAEGNRAKALGWLEKAKAADPDNIAARVALASYYLLEKNFQRALDEATEAQRLHPDDADTLNVLGEAQAANRQVNESIATFKRVVALRPDSPIALYRLASAELAARNTSEASDNLRKAIGIKPDYVLAVVALARLDVAAGHADQALSLARDLQKAAPKSAAGLALEGDVLMAQKRPGDAVAAYQRALAIEQTGLLAVKLHSAQTGAGQAKEADATLQRWLQSHPDDVVGLEYSASQDLKAGRNKQAIEQFERVLRKAPNNAFTLNNLAVLYKRENDPRAVATAEQAYKLAPGSPMIADTLGWILVEQGATTRGLDLLQKAATASPKNSEIQYHLAVALAKAGDKAKSRQQLEALLARDKTFAQREAAEALLKKL